MTYNSWKLMDKIDVAVRTGNGSYDFTGYIVEHGDKDALEKAKDWATVRNYNSDKREYDDSFEPDVHTFDNNGFTAKILDSAGGSSQGGRLSFWRCEVEKDGIRFTIGVNDAVLADLIKSSDISNGAIKQKVMFARKAGQPGLIHEGMESYKDAVADMQQKATLKASKKTSKWELGGVYQTLTQTDVCIGEVWDTMEEYEERDNSYSYSRPKTKLRKCKIPVKMMAWLHIYRFQDREVPSNLEEAIRAELDSNYVYFYVGKPPARTRTKQLIVKDTDIRLIDELLSKGNNGRYVREP